MTFRSSTLKIICLAAFTGIAYKAEYNFTGGAVPTAVNALGILAAIAWLAYALSRRFIATRPVPYPHQRDMTQADLAIWRNQPLVRAERRIYALTWLATLTAAVLVVLAVAFLLWQAFTAFLSYGQATWVALAICTAMLFCTDAFKLFQRPAPQPKAKDWQPLNPEGLVS